MAEEITIASEQKRLERLSNEMAEAVKTQETAQKTAVNHAKSKPDDIAGLVTCANAVSDADKLVAKCQSGITAAKGNMGRLEWEQKAKPLMDARETLKEAVLVSCARVTDVFKRFGVEAVAIKIDTSGDALIATLNVTGEGIPKPPASVKRTGGGGGGRAPLVVDGAEYASASAALATIFPDFEGKMGRVAIISKLERAGHSVS